MSLASPPCWDFVSHGQWPQQLANLPAGTCSHARKLPTERWTMQDGIASGENKKGQRGHFACQGFQTAEGMLWEGRSAASIAGQQGTICAAVMVR